MDVSVLEGMAVPESAKFIGFFAQETQLFFNAMKRAAGHFSETGSLPKSLFKAKDLKSLQKVMPKKKRASRKPSAFNIFVKRRLEEIKRSGGPAVSDDPRIAQQTLFRRAVKDWSALSADQKSAYAAQLEEAEAEGSSADDLPLPRAVDADMEVVDVSPRKHKEKKKKRDKERKKDKKKKAKKEAAEDSD